MDWIVTIVIGAFCGWLSSLLMKASAQMGAFLNIVVGAIGALVGRWFFGGVLQLEAVNTAGAFTGSGVLWALVGAASLIAIVKAVDMLGGKPIQP